VPYYERQPYIQPLYSVVSDVMRGEIRVPRFQRPGTEETWTDEQRGDLLDSLYRGFPIGTLLLWSTAKKIRTLDQVGGVAIPPAPESSTTRLVLDGHQRISTLVLILGAGLRGELGRVPPPAQKLDADSDAPQKRETGRWVFDLAPSPNSDSTRERFVLLRSEQNPTETQLPLDIALDRAALNKWIREKKESLKDEEIAAADALRDRLREYNIPVAVLVADSLQDATESFKRINSSGQPMSAFNMVAALAYQEDFDPQEVFQHYRSELLEPIGWQDVSDSDILRVCAAKVGQAPLKFGVEDTAKKLSENREVIESSFRQIRRAADKLGSLCGIYGPKALPYSWQLITLAICFPEDRSEFSGEESDRAIRRWFWITTYGEVFGGVNSAVYDRSKRALEDMMRGASGDETQMMQRDVAPRVRAPQRFDFRAARSKACALAMARYQDKDVNGDGIQDVPSACDSHHRALASLGVSAMHTLTTTSKRSLWWHQVVVPEGTQVTQYRDALKRRADGTASNQDRTLLATIFVPEDKDGDVDALLEARRVALLRQEKEFVETIGLQWADP